MSKARDIIKLCEQYEWKSGLVVEDLDGTLLHTCLYVHNNPLKEVENLAEELKEDESHNLSMLDRDEYTIRVMTPEELKYFVKDIVGIPNEDLWAASKPGFSPGISATTQLIPEQGKSRYIATNKGMMKGYWKVMDTETNQTVQSGIRSKEVAQEQANKWNKGIYSKR